MFDCDYKNLYKFCGENCRMCFNIKKPSCYISNWEIYEFCVGDKNNISRCNDCLLYEKYEYISERYK